MWGTWPARTRPTGRRTGPSKAPWLSDAGENVFNDAFLVPRGRGEAFRAEAARAGQGLAGIRVEVTGPWAPYSFAMPVNDTDGGDDSVRSVGP